MDYKKEFDKINNGFIKSNNYQFVEYKNNQCIMEAPITDSSINPYEIAHGGFIFGIMDTCSGIHIALETNRKVVTTSSNINYIKACTGSKIIAKSKAIKIGKTISVIEVNAYNDKNELVANGCFNFFML